MTVQELMEELEYMDPEATVLLAHQPSWPLQYTIDGVFEVQGKRDDPEPTADQFADEADYEEAWDAWEERQDAPEETTVYIAERSQVYDAPYLPGAAAAVIGWR